MRPWWTIAAALGVVGCDVSGAVPETPPPVVDPEVLPPEDGEQDFPDTTLEIGSPTGDGGFATLPSGSEVPIVHGSQGGIHVEVKLRVSEPLGVLQLLAELRCATRVEGEEVAVYHVSAHPFELAADGAYYSPTTYVRFDSDDASEYDGLDARVTCSVAFDGGGAKSTRALHLADSPPAARHQEL